MRALKACCVTPWTVITRSPFARIPTEPIFVGFLIFQAGHMKQEFVGGVSECNCVQCNYAWCRNMRIGDICISAPCVVRDRLVLQSRSIDQPITPQAAMSWRNSARYTENVSDLAG